MIMITKTSGIVLVCDGTYPKHNHDTQFMTRAMWPLMAMTTIKHSRLLTPSLCSYSSSTLSETDHRNYLEIADKVAHSSKVQAVYKHFYEIKSM